MRDRPIRWTSFNGIAPALRGGAMSSGGIAPALRGGAMSVLIVLLSGLACGDDAVSDEDLIERFIEDVTGKVDDAYVGRALGYVDMSRYPLDVRVPHHGGVYPEERAPEIIAQFKKAMRRYFYDTEIKLRSDTFEIKGDSAEVKLGLMTAVGPLGASFTLRKAGEGVWKVSRVHVDR
jgi:hypothetical protein